ncbi:MAG: outer membrane protein assembly factor BamA, partial [Saprospiraceae bacterium]|nr:outer membrane protein assembly factor BamA [Saprospiraceae bacterium]
MLLPAMVAQDTTESSIDTTEEIVIPDEQIDYSKNNVYEIGEVKVSGANFSDENAIRIVSGLKKGKKITIPGPDIKRSIQNLWRQKLFTDIQIIQEKVIGDVVFLEIILQERPRLSRYTYSGTKKVYEEELNTLLKPFLLRGGIVTDATKVNTITAIKNFFVKKGYLDVEVEAVETPDPNARNAIILDFQIDRKERIKVEDIVMEGVEATTPKKLRKQMKNTKWRKRFLASSKFIKDDYEEDKRSITAYYNTIGYRDARIISDTLWRDDEGKLYLGMTIDEGRRYYFRDITWKGNSIYEDDILEERLGIKPGDVYNQELLDQRLSFSLDGRDVSSLYMDNGYLFFRVDPTEIAIDNDSIDLEMRIFEGPQATIDRVSIAGNDRTHEHVIRRELRTKPGEKFSRAELIRSQRQIINLGYFNPETIGMNTPVNPNRGTVDIEYQVEEKSSDQLELSAGYQPSNAFYRGGLIGTLGVTFNNFSLRNLKNGKAWKPLPQGDGQKVSIRAQTNGQYY